MFCLFTRGVLAVIDWGKGRIVSEQERVSKWARVLSSTSSLLRWLQHLRRGQTRLKPRAQNLVWVSYMGDSDQSMWTMICRLPVCSSAWELSLNSNQGTIQNAGVWLPLTALNACPGSKVRKKFLLSLLQLLLCPHFFLFFFFFFFL